MSSSVRSLTISLCGLACVGLGACTSEPADDADSAGQGESEESDDDVGVDGEESEEEESDDGESDGGESDGGETGELPDDLFNSDVFLNIAHRGGSRLRPEETLIAFEHALSVGAEVIEMDLHESSDGVIVLMHDATVDDTTDGTGAVNEMTFDQLRELDAGYTFTQDGGETYPYRGMGVQIATLDEVLDAFPDAYYLMEIKQYDPPMVGHLVETLYAHDVGDRVIVASFDADTTLAFRAAAPDLYTAMSFTEMTELNQNIGSPDYVAPAGFAQTPWELTSQEVVDYCHEIGVRVQAWTANDELLMLDLIALGVDGVMTDDPVLLESVAP